MNIQSRDVVFSCDSNAPGRDFPISIFLYKFWTNDASVRYKTNSMTKSKRSSCTTDIHDDPREMLCGLGLCAQLVEVVLVGYPPRYVPCWNLSYTTYTQLWTVSLYNAYTGVFGWLLG